MIVALLTSYFGWLPLSLSIPAFAVISVFLFVLILRILGYIVDFVFRLIDLFL